MSSKMADALPEQGRELHKLETKQPGLGGHILQRLDRILERFWQMIEARTMPGQSQQQGDRRKGKRNMTTEPPKSTTPTTAHQVELLLRPQRHGVDGEDGTAPASSRGSPNALTLTGHRGSWHRLETRNIDPRTILAPKSGDPKPTDRRTLHRWKKTETHPL
ncbi:Hypothetical predicted protein [Pelobates cultripes]|uniref:Uncharacterized protein n=1 Tax=Pelobates cultripes TaxID=61616 RepID=A0AAD1R6U2_PELCU|nr:Hypothetical predicted protein [Pelobates cultripes]